MARGWLQSRATGRRPLRWLLPFALVLWAGSGVSASPGGQGRPLAATEVNLRPPPGLRSRSLGAAHRGTLVNGMKVRESAYLRYVGEYARGGNFYGTWELVQLLERAARRVAFRLPGAKLSIGELSAQDGGRLDGHRSHRSGRDADIGFYLTLPDGRPYYTHSFADMDGRGRGMAPNGYLRFDDARNWELVAKLVTDGEARVQYIFVSEPLKARILREGEKRGAHRQVLERVRAVLVEPNHGHPHQNHFHVRIYCAPADRGRCEDRPPYWPWYPGSPPGGVYSTLSRP